MNWASNPTSWISSNGGVCRDKCQTQEIHAEKRIFLTLMSNNPERSHPQNMESCYLFVKYQQFGFDHLLFILPLFCFVFREFECRIFSCNTNWTLLNYNIKVSLHFIEQNSAGRFFKEVHIKILSLSDIQKSQVSLHSILTIKLIY